MDLNRAATFLRVVETGGFTAAAAALGLPTSSVSRSVAKLEEDLGVVLLERTTRRVSLTEVGRAYFERVRDALAGLDAATAAALDAANEPRGMIPISRSRSASCPIPRWSADASARPPTSSTPPRATSKSAASHARSPISPATTPSRCAPASIAGS